MQVVKATSLDITEIITVLKSSLGEGLLPKSAEYFIWKHIENPFGESKILLAKENNQIIGVRAFMYWNWVCGTENVKTVRAVDTATLPSHQGKGIFKKLTLQAVNECTKEGTEFVFNSPNKISIIGYLKMGWYENGKLPIYIKAGSILPRLFSEKSVNNLLSIYTMQASLDQLDSNWEIKNSITHFHTGINKAFLKWRYQDCPVANYGAVIEPGFFGFVFRIKKVNKFIELRICELWTDTADGAKQAKQAYKKLTRKIRPAVVTCGISPLFHHKKNNPLGFFGPFKKGPTITLKTLASKQLNSFNQFKQWNPSMGSIELF
jgi:GNAT superfamily N-acetyltransferase